MKSVEESVQQLTEQFFQFCKKTRRQRINLRNRTERLSELLDWKRMGLEYRKARLLVLKRKYPEAYLTTPSTPDSINADEEEESLPYVADKIARPMSAHPGKLDETVEDMLVNSMEHTSIRARTDSILRQ